MFCRDIRKMPCLFGGGGGSCLFVCFLCVFLLLVFVFFFVFFFFFGFFFLVFFFVFCFGFFLCFCLLVFWVFFLKTSSGIMIRNVISCVSNN